jgi:hypothetical protein
VLEAKTTDEGSPCLHNHNQVNQVSEMKERGNENDVEGKSYLEVNTLFLAERHDVCASLEWVEVDLAHRQSPGAHE